MLFRRCAFACTEHNAQQNVLHHQTPQPSPRTVLYYCAANCSVRSFTDCVRAHVATRAHYANSVGAVPESKRD